MAGRPLGNTLGKAFTTRRAAAIVALMAALAFPLPGAHAGSAPGPGAPVALTVDGLTAPLGLGANDVSFGWHLNDPRAGAAQTAYRIVVHAALAPAKTIWDSGRVESAAQAFVPYSGPPLAADSTYRWSVQTWDANGVAGPFADPATFDIGLSDADWHADWIKRTTVEPDDSQDTFNLQYAFGVWENKDEYTYVRKEARLGASPITRARAYISADQQYELYVNGNQAGKGQAYEFPDSQYYETLDITKQLRAGATNAFGIIYNWQGPGKGRPAGTPGVIAHISVLHRDGSRELLTTDGTWKVLPGAWLPGTQRDEEGDPVDYTENIDGPAQPVGWDRPGYLDAAWAPATVIGPHPTAPWTHLVSVRTRLVYEPIRASSLTTLPSGAVVADFGRVYAAIPTVTFRHGVPGHLVTMHTGILLDPGSGQVSTTHGTQHTDNSDSYIERGGVETFRPFDYLGFRYLQIDDPAETLRPSDVVALARHAAVPDEHAGTFTSSNPTLDSVFELGRHSALFAMQEQFVDTPTREKGSWLGDGRNESETAMDVFADTNMTRKSLYEFAESQARFWPDGAINKLYPTGIGGQQIPQGTEEYPDWVWFYWMHTGDRTALAHLYPVVAKVSDFLWSFVNRTSGLITNISGATDVARYPTDTSINVAAVNVFRRVAALGTADGRPASEIATQQHREAFLAAAINARLVDANGLYVVGLDASGHRVGTPAESLNASTLQSTNAYALLFGVVPPSRVPQVEKYVVSLGMATPPEYVGDLLDALRVAGDDTTMLHLLTDPSQPGWANILARGATFTWEVWNPVDNDVPIGGTPVGSFFGNGDSMSHGASSNVSAEIQEALLGVQPTSPGFATFDVAPPVDALAFARGTVPTPYGSIRVQWTRRPTFAVDVDVPAGTHATIHLPSPASPITLGAGSYHLRAAGAASAASAAATNARPADGLDTPTHAAPSPLSRQALVPSRAATEKHLTWWPALIAFVLAGAFGRRRVFRARSATSSPSRT